MTNRTQEQINDDMNSLMHEVKEFTLMVEEQKKKKTLFRGKLSLEPGTPMYLPCHNDLKKKMCDGCMGCIDPHCSGIHCDRTVILNGEKTLGDCTCIKTQCICLGRPGS